MTITLATRVRPSSLNWPKTATGMLRRRLARLTSLEGQVQVSATAYLLTFQVIAYQFQSTQLLTDLRFRLRFPFGSGQVSPPTPAALR